MGRVPLRDHLLGSPCWRRSADKKALVSICEVVDAPEHFVGFPVPASTFPPTFNDPFVVSKDPEVLAWLTGCGKRACKKLEANGLSPSDVPAIRLPPWEDMPRSPLIADNNADAKI